MDKTSFISTVDYALTILVKHARVKALIDVDFNVWHTNLIVLMGLITLSQKFYLGSKFYVVWNDQLISKFPHLHSKHMGHIFAQ